MTISKESSEVGIRSFDPFPFLPRLLDALRDGTSVPPV